MSRRLFRIPFLVKPTPANPSYYDWGIGVLYLWLIDDSAETASARAQQIVAVLPYEVLRHCEVREGTDDTRPQMQQAKQMALDCGFGIVALVLAVGEDDAVIDAVIERAVEMEASEKWKFQG